VPLSTSSAPPSPTSSPVTSSTSTSSTPTFTGAAHRPFTPLNLRWSSPTAWVLLLLVNALQL
jgi:hypothetical protein